MEVEQQGPTRSVAFEMLGPPRNTKLLFEAHFLRECFTTMSAVRGSTPEEVTERLNAFILERKELANEAVSVGVPIYLASGQILRGPKTIIPARADNVEITPELLEGWIHDGWVDLRRDNCAKWIDRFQAIHDETEAIPDGDTSSRYLRNRKFWDEGKRIQPGKIVGWILSVEEQGDRIKR